MGIIVGGPKAIALPTAASKPFRVFVGRDGGPPPIPDDFDPSQGSNVSLWEYQELVDLLRHREWLLEWAWEQFADAEDRLPDLRREVRFFVTETMRARFPSCGGSVTFAKDLAEREHREKLFELETVEAEKAKATRLMQVLEQQISSLQTRMRAWEAQFNSTMKRR